MLYSFWYYPFQMKLNWTPFCQEHMWCFPSVHGAKTLHWKIGNIQPSYRILWPNEREEPAASYRWADWNWKKLIEMKNFRLISDMFSRKFDIPSINLRNNRTVSMSSRLIMEKLGFWLIFSNFSPNTVVAFHDMNMNWQLSTLV
jgi:hypothetical protein